MVPLVDHQADDWLGMDQNWTLLGPQKAPWQDVKREPWDRQWEPVDRVHLTSVLVVIQEDPTGRGIAEGCI